VIDPADGALVRGCGLSLPTADMSIAVTSHAVYALSATGIVYLVPTDSDGTGRCHAFATENRTFALAPPMESGPVAAGSALILGDSQRVYQLDADDLGEDGSYFPASGQPAEYRGEPIAVAVDSMQIQTPTAIEETLPVYTVDGEGLVHSSSNGVRAMAPTEIGASRAPLVDSSGVIIIAEDGTVIAYSHDLDDERWQTRIGSVRHAGLDEGILYLTDEVGVVVLDAASGSELWALETKAAAAAGGGGRVFVVTTSGELEAYEIGDSASDPVAVQPAARRQIEEPVVVAERLLAAFNAGDVAGVMARYAADAELDEVHLMEEENWRDLSDHVSSLAIFGWQIEPRNCAVGEERGPGLVVTCDAVAFDPVDEILGITADGVIDLVIADGLVRRTLGEQDELWWLTNLGFIYTPTPGYTEAIDAWLEWAEVRYGEGWDAVCDSDSEDIFETDRLCAAVGEEAAREYIAETGG